MLLDQKKKLTLQLASFIFCCSYYFSYLHILRYFCKTLESVKPTWSTIKYFHIKPMRLNEDPPVRRHP